jgi:putative nucleotidyltransferase with HDIG domain
MNLNPFPTRTTILALLDLIELQDPALRRHSESVASIAVAIAGSLGRPAARLRTAALLHDVGKLGVPRSVILKPAPLTPAEYELIRRHPVTGFHIVDGIGLEREARWVLHHHERPDGHGYPDGLRDQEIPVEASILHVADAFDALTSDRPYRSALTVTEAFDTIADGAETEFDATCVAGLMNVLSRSAGEQPIKNR